MQIELCDIKTLEGFLSDYKNYIDKNSLKRDLRVQEKIRYYHSMIGSIQSDILSRMGGDDD